MVVKKCPGCDQTLPVACKSCHCGHVFISRKQQLPEKTELEGFNREKRLRPEVPKREIQDFEYGLSSSTIEQDSLVKIKIPVLPGTSRDGTQITVGTPVSSLCDIRVPDQFLQVNGKRKRGRPKGSKNKPKPPPGEQPESTTPQEPSDPNKPKRGRPKGSKNKPKDPLRFTGSSHDGWSSDQDYVYPIDVEPHISKEKAITYSIVLSDINQKLMNQTSMNFV
ncbi:predicted protein [Nematostella vectensis]|uniref:UPF0547 domain-containing protein n=1 Tax=Nematostella vectensis TaxID=45351 RepID=A7RMP1_NEMVE|nr:uncharacterized protein LOC5519539 [Nematostella vectensis]XP_048576399.1 uncharacterized protein LOC5519539 [Nematostella vectensis]EDO47380.1 predicted protein [Nematostella vectensis]|eukprot:XP_001639443.1 predicted protein [Nematostella vectensis]